MNASPLHCPDCGKELKPEAGTEIRSTLCPYCGSKLDLELLDENALLSKPAKVFSTTIKLVFAGLVIFIIATLFFICSHANVGKLTQTVDPNKSTLELVNWSWGLNEDGKTIEAVGEVKNISDKQIPGIQAVVIFYDKQNSVIATATTSLKDNLTPSQAYPFRVTQNDNPAMEKAGIVFLSLQGDTLRTETRINKTQK